MRQSRFAVVLGLLLLAACSSAAEIDPLAPVPTRVDPDEVAIPALRVEWTYESLDDEGTVEVPTHAPAVGGRLVFVPYAGRIEAVGAGLLAWTVVLRDPLVSAPLALGDGVVLPTAAGWLYLDGGGSPSALLEWSDPVEDAFVVDSSIVVIGGTTISRLDVDESGISSRWRSTHPGGGQGLVGQDGDTVFATSNDGTLNAYDLSSGARRWTSDRVELAPLRPAIDPGTSVSLVFAIGADGRVYGIRQRDGSRAWVGKDIGMRSHGSPVALEGLVWAPGLDAAAHAFTSGGGSHQFRVPANGRVYLDLAVWGSWVIVSPQYGPWVLITGPRQRSGPADPGNPRIERIDSDDDILLPAGVGVPGVALVDSAGSVRFITPERGVAPPG